MLTGVDARRYLDARHVALSTDEVRVVTAYSVDSRPVNMPLRGFSPSGSRKPPTPHELLHALEEGAFIEDAIDRQEPLDRVVTTWRAVGPSRLREYLHRPEAVYPAFQSSSTNRKHVGKTYMRGDDHRLLRITLPIGARVLHLPSVGDGGTLKAEDEVLMRQQSMLRIDAIRDEFIEVTLL